MAVNQLTAIGMGLTVFAIVIGLGMVILSKMGDNIVVCSNIGGAAATWNVSSQLCQNVTGSTAAGAGTAFSTIGSVSGYMGTSGLAGWIPVIIVVLIAGLIMALFGGLGKNKY